MEIVIATRKSKLAQIQADYIGNLLKENTNLSYKKLLIVTEGDKRLDVSLSKIGGKGLFTKEVELSLLDKSADLAVHSMKDLPYILEEEFEIVAIPKREDVRDVFISSNNIHFKELKKGAQIGTSSIRRRALLLEKRPDLNIVPIRGNIETRLKKMKEEKMDGIVLASAALKRLNMENIITDYFDPTDFLPAIGQGALGVESLKNNEKNKIFKEINHINSRIQVEAERSFMKKMNGDCHSLIGAYSKIEGTSLYLIGTFMVNNKIIKRDIYGKIEDHITLGEKLGELIIKGV